MTLSLKTDDLFQPTTLGKIELSNRIAMAPLTRSRADANGVVNSMHAEYYAQRATTGLIISEATNISSQGRGYAYTPGIWTNDHITAWKKVTEAVHTAGGKIVCQLWHVGRFSHVSLQPQGGAPVAPSAIQAEGMTFTENGFERVSVPRALETNEIPALLEDYRKAARAAKEAGFDGVEVHSANSYLLDQFIRDSTNKRTDRYGGSIENRTRLTREVVEAVSEVWDSGYVGIRLSPITPDAGNTPLDSQVMDTYGYLIEKLNDYNLAYMHFVEGATAASRDVPAGIDLAALRRIFKGSYIANNGYTLAMAKDARSAGSADVIAFGRPFIANPDLVARFKNNLPLAEADKSTFYGGGAEGYTDWPMAS
ncbi:alkene reductase [Agrobacterium tumefaciens]|uniref:alkene reductase n=1 Tax=Agrobacterium tumefaciens TaxID=358 RepID=UPI001571CE4E|nr:alkene reductase [Agrobacterium tumefaciens]NTB97344.1 alkene reductase [Agrobacterium tumefaciens]NTC45094.1 alkene reductase [Agrobacterium tumefaciens]